MSDYPKPIKRLLREYLAEAHERELHRELTKLDRSFAEWRAGKIGSKPSSDDYRRYAVG
jgi:hypothetical protein